MAWELDPATGQMRQVDDINPPQAFGRMPLPAADLPQPTQPAAPPQQFAQPMAPMPLPAPSGGGNITRVNKSTSDTQGRSLETNQVSDAELDQVGRIEKTLDLQGQMAQSQARMKGLADQSIALEKEQAERAAAERRQRIEDITQQRTDKALANHSDLNAKYQKMAEDGPRDFWADKSTGSKIIAALARGLGAYAAGMTGGKNHAGDLLDNMIAQDFAKQRDTIQNLKESVVMARTGVDDAVQARKIMLEENALKEAAARESLAIKQQRWLAKMGITPEQIAADKIVVDNTNKANEIRLQTTQAMRQRISEDTRKTQGKDTSTGPAATFGVPTIPTGNPGADIDKLDLSGPEAEAAAKVMNLSDDLRIIAQDKGQTAAEALMLVKQNRDKQNVVDSTSVGSYVSSNLLGRTGNVYEGLTPAQKRTMLANDRYLTTMRNIISGTGSSDAEKRDLMAAFTPIAGDDPDTVQEKYQAGYRYATNLAIRSGKAAPIVRDALERGAAKPAAPARPSYVPPGAQRRTLETGETMWVDMATGNAWPAK